MDDDPHLHVETAAEFGDWLSANHDTETGKRILHWVATAKRPETRERRVTDTAHKAARGERAQR